MSANQPLAEPVEDLTGPFEETAWPSRLQARVVLPGKDPCIHGYAVEGDLARNYALADMLYLSLTGELPSPETARAFEVALLFLTPVAIDEAPTHAAALARLCAAPAPAVLAVAAVGLAERARFIVERHADLLAWLERPEGAPPSAFLSAEPGERESVMRLRAALPSSFPVPALELPLTRQAALLGVLVACGLRRTEQLEAVWTMAGLVSSFAEAMATPPTGFREYPMNLPAFHYEAQP